MEHSARATSCWIPLCSVRARNTSGPNAPSRTRETWFWGFSARFASVPAHCDSRSISVAFWRMFAADAEPELSDAVSRSEQSKMGPRAPSTTIGRLMRVLSDRCRSAPTARICSCRSSSRATAISERSPPSCAKVTLWSLLLARSRIAATAWRWIETSRILTRPISGWRPPLEMMASWLPRLGLSLRKQSAALYWHSLSCERATEKSDRRPSSSRNTECVAVVERRLLTARLASRWTLMCLERMR